MSKLSYKSLFLILVFLLIPIVLLIRINQKGGKVEASWWDETWSFRKTVTINNSSDSEITNQYVKITLDTSNLITNNKLQADCDDIRITNQDGELLSHFIDGDTSYACNTATTSIYVLDDHLPKNESLLYIYYGNQSATNIEPKLGTNSHPALSCKNILTHRSDNQGDGTYYIIPGGNMADIIQTECNMTDDSGGWTKVYDGLCTSATSTTRTTGNLLEISSPKLAFDSMRINAKNWNYSNIKTTTETAVMQLTFSGYYEWLHNQPDSSPNPDVKFHSAQDGIQDVNFTTTGVMMMGYGNSWRRILPSFFTQPHDSYMYLGTLGSVGINRLEWGYGDYNSHMNDDFPQESGLGLTPLKFQQIEVWVKENEITLLSDQTTNLGTVEEVSPAPLFYWKFDENSGTTATDSINKLPLNNLTSISWTDSCISSSCIQNTQNNSYFTTTSSPSLNLTNSVTYNFWLKLSSNYQASESGRWPIMMANNSGNTHIGYGFRTNLTTNTNQNSGSIYFEYGLAPCDNSAFSSTGGISSPFDSQWHMYTMTYDGQNIKIYRDAKLYSTKAFTQGFCDLGSNSLRFAQVYNESPGATIDEAKVYAYPRTSDQIKSDYNAGLASLSSQDGSSVAIGGDTSSKDLSDGLVAYWKMDDPGPWNGTSNEIKDHSGNNLHATSIGTTRPQPSEGKFGNSASFNGVTDYSAIRVTTNATLAITGDVSVGAWVKPSSSYTDSAQYILREGIYSDQLYSLSFNANNNTVAFTWWDGNWKSVTSNTGVVPFDTWSYIFATRSGTNIKIYINGQLNISSNTGTTPIGETPELRIGGSGSNVQDYSGLIDEVRIYNRALSDSEISSLYKYKPPPVAHYTFEEGSGSTLYDKSSNNYTGTWSGTGTRYNTGKIGKAGIFNNSNDNVSLPLQNHKSISVSTWFYHTQKDTLSADALLGSWYWNSNNQLRQGYDLRFYTNRDYIEWIVETTNGSTISELQCPSSDLPLNQWIHVTGTYDSETGTCKLYVDGVLNNQVAGTPGNTIVPLSNYSDIRIGYSRVNNGYFTGKIDDLKIYNYAITQDQIIQDINTNSQTSALRSPLAHYKFDEGYGSTFNNSGFGGSTLNGTITNATWTSSGKFGKALNYDGSGDYTSVSHNSTLNFGLNNFSISYWLNFNPGSTQERWSLGKGYPYQSTGPGWAIANWTSGDPITPYLYVSDGTGGPVSHSLAFKSMNRGSWYQLTFVVNRDDNLVKTYVNGLYANQLDISSLGSFDNTDNFLLGTGNGPTNYSDLKIDEVKIYNYALSADEIKQDYNQSSTFVFGSSSQTIGSTTTSLDYCLPGDTSPCSPPIAEYKFEEGSGTTAYDTSTNNKHGVFGTGSSAPSWSTGKVGKGVFFDGTPGKHISADVGSGNSNVFTMQAWIYPTNYTGSGTANDRNTILYSNNKYLQLYNDGRISVYIYGTASPGYHYSNSTVPLNQWSHVGYTYDGSNIKIFINGSLDAVIPNTGTPFDGWTDTKIGYQNPSYERQFDGKIDNLRIYNYARSPAQVAWDYNQGKPIAHWKMDECQGNTLHDSSGNNIHGTATIGSSGSQSTSGTCQTSSTAWANGQSGKINSSYSFDGTDDYISLGTPASLNQTGPISVSTWIKPDSGSGQMGILSGSLIRDSLSLYIRHTPNADIAFWYNPDGTVRKIMGGTLNYDQWNHIVATWDGTNSKLYLNGQPISGSQSTEVRSRSFSSMNIGYTSDLSSPKYFDGLIDDLRVYNYPLTSEQVKQIYNNGAINFQ